jgi:hypothetical protein
MLNTLALLTVAVYAAVASPDDGPGATPLLMAGLLSLGVIILALTSAVNALLWGALHAHPWWCRLGWVFIGFAGALLVLQLALYASDHNNPTLRQVGLLLFPGSVTAAYVLNRRALAQCRKQP